jgi:tetratricopeptide (TPR) repeat protein
MLLEETQTGPKHGEPAAFYGAMHIRLGMPEQALPVLRQAKGLSPRSFVVNYELGRVLLTLDHLDECDSFLLAAADLALNFSRTYYLLGTLRQKQNRLAESRLHFAKLEELNKSAQNPEFPLTDR